MAEKRRKSRNANEKKPMRLAVHIVSQLKHRSMHLRIVKHIRCFYCLSSLRAVGESIFDYFGTENFFNS